jgi:hypothetical protein
MKGAAGLGFAKAQALFVLGPNSDKISEVNARPQWGRVMAGYRVRFFKRLVNSQGSPFKALQREIEIIEAETALEAEKIAEREFERMRKIPDWHTHADFVETEVVVTSAHKQAA